eukprot:TRINITY_DN1799_c0_g1_i3.p1 TRINITY_DN1799_c0_g1~~TRINITY_DN1799_c0_g1_i3.p1  ORF type:complete len:836 (-),score=168.71 TRINITY_DN1799_c0_g1_i3:484-2631(-)
MDVDFDEPLIRIQEAVRAICPTANAAELGEIEQQLASQCKTTVSSLRARLSGQEDHIIIHEQVMQAKVTLFRDWIRILQQSSLRAAAMGDGFSQLLQSLERTHADLFASYPGFLADDGETGPGQADDVADDIPEETVTRTDTAQRTRAQKVSACLSSYAEQMFPALQWLREYPYLGCRAAGLPVPTDRRSKVRGSLRTLKDDLIGGLTLGLLMVPQSIAYVGIAALPAIVGLNSGFLPALAYSLLCTSRHCSNGPNATLSLLFIAAFQGVGISTPAEMIAVCSALAFLVACIQLGLGLLRVGNILSNLLSAPVVSGYISASALLILISQLGTGFGLSIPNNVYGWMTFYTWCVNLPQTKGYCVLMSCLGLAILLVLKRLHPRIPGSLILPIIGIIITWAGGLDTRGISIVGTIPGGLPRATAPPWWIMNALVKDAFLIALIGFVEHFSTAKLWAAKHGYSVDPNQELIALGIGNFAAAFFGGCPCVASLARSSVNGQSGTRTPIAALLAVLIMGICLGALTFVFEHIPKPILASIVVSAVIPLIDYGLVIRLWHQSKLDSALVVITFMATFWAGVQIGVLIAISTSIVILLAGTARPHTAILGRLPGTAVYRDVASNPEAVTIPGVIIWRFDSQIFFGNCDFLRLKMLKLVDLLGEESDSKRFRAVIMDCSPVTNVDITGIETLREVSNAFAKHHVGMLICFTSCGVCLLANLSD